MTVVVLGLEEDEDKWGIVELLKEEFGCPILVDGWHFGLPIVTGAVHLTAQEPPLGWDAVPVFRCE